MTVVSMLAAALLVVVAAVGCGGSEDSSHEKSESPGAPAVTSSDVGLLLPGDQRVPRAATVTTRMRLPIARTSSPARRPVPTTRPATARTTATTAAVPPG